MGGGPAVGPWTAASAGYSDRSTATCGPAHSFHAITFHPNLYPRLAAAGFGGVRARPAAAAPAPAPFSLRACPPEIFFPPRHQSAGQTPHSAMRDHGQPAYAVTPVPLPEPPVEEVTSIGTFMQCKNSHSQYVLVPNTDFDKLKGIVAWERAFLYTFKGAARVADVLPTLGGIVNGDKLYQKQGRSLYIALAMTHTGSPYMLLAVEHDAVENVVWQAYIHRFHYTTDAPRDAAADLHRAVWHMLKPETALLQTPTGGDYLSAPYMVTVLQTMAEWDEKVTVLHASSLFRQADYQATNPKVNGFEQSEAGTMKVIKFEFEEPKFEIDWKGDLATVPKGFDAWLAFEENRANVYNFVQLNYRKDLATKLGGIGVTYDGDDKILLTDAHGNALTLHHEERRVVGYKKDDSPQRLANVMRRPFAIIKAFLQGKNIADAEAELKKPYLPPPT